MLRVEMLSTGDEVLYGQIVDTNAAWLADYFFNEGLPLTRRMTCGDQLTQLVENIRQITQQADILIINGGLGPTSDDLTAQAIAEAAQVSLVENPHWIAVMEDFFHQRGREMAPTNRKQACLPDGAKLIDNPVGTACGFAMSINNCLVFCTPGVPHEFKVMVTEQILPYLRQHLNIPAAPICLRMTTLGCSESDLARQFDPLLLPDNVVLGYRSAMPIIELKLTGPAEQQQAMQQIWQQMEQTIPSSILYQGTTTVFQLLANYLQQQQKTVMVKESFTAGLLSWQLQQANVPVNYGEIFNDNCCHEDLQHWVHCRKIERKTEPLTNYCLQVSGQHEQGHFYLALKDHKKIVGVQVKFLTKQSSAMYQQILTLYAASLFYRYLQGRELIWCYGWIETQQLIEQTS